MVCTRNGKKTKCKKKKCAKWRINLSSGRCGVTKRNKKNCKYNYSTKGMNNKAKRKRKACHKTNNTAQWKKHSSKKKKLPRWMRPQQGGEY